MAAVLACGPGAVLSHRSAADLHALRRTDRASIEVTVPGRRRVKIDGINVHNSDTLTNTDLTEVGGIPCTSVARTLFDLAAVVNKRSVERAVEQADAERVLNLRRLADVLERNPRARGAKLVAAIVADYTAEAPTESKLEEVLYACLRAGGLPLPRRQFYIDPGDGEPMIRADFAWPAQKLVVETDGAKFHGTRAAFESDPRRDQRLVLAGWRVIRITWRQLEQDPGRIQRMIATALGQRP